MEPVIGRAFTRPVGYSNDGDGVNAACELSDHQHVEDDHRRQAQDHRPNAERPKNVLGTKPLVLREWIVLSVHDGPGVFVLCGDVDRRRILKSRS